MWRPCRHRRRTCVRKGLSVRTFSQFVRLRSNAGRSSGSASGRRFCLNNTSIQIQGYGTVRGCYAHWWEYVSCVQIGIGALKRKTLPGGCGEAFRILTGLGARSCRNRSGSRVSAWGRSAGERVSTTLPAGRPACCERSAIRRSRSAALIWSAPGDPLGGSCRRCVDHFLGRSGDANCDDHHKAML